MKMHVLSGGRLRMPRHVYLPGAPLEETIDLSVSCFLFRHPQGNLLFDTGCHPSVATAPESRWGQLARTVVPIMSPSENIVAALRKIDLTPDDIEIVVNSHLHCDHCGCNAYFRRSTVYVHKDELAFARRAGVERQGYFDADWRNPMPVVEVSDEVDVFGDGRLVLLPLPGHTPGLTGLLATLPNSGVFLLASDAVPLRQTLESEIMPKNIWDMDRQSESLVEIRRIEKSGATVLCGHDMEQWSTLNAAETPYD